MTSNQASTPIAAFDIIAPQDQSTPVVFASPHSGNNYPEHFVAASRLDSVALRRSEDAFVDELYQLAPKLGAPLLRATFPRAFIDPNREPYELDQDMFKDTLPDYVNTASPRAAAGLGTIARVVTNGAEIYRDKLNFNDAKQWIEDYYTPYHAALSDLIEKTRQRFGACLLIDCHSMPSAGGPMDLDPGLKRTEFVLGDHFSRSCSGWITDLVQSTLENQDFIVRRNEPYAGGFTTRHYGHPENNVHVLQIEIDRALYMNELTITRLGRFNDTVRRLNAMIERVCQITADDLLRK